MCYYAREYDYCAPAHWLACIMLLLTSPSSMTPHTQQGPVPTHCIYLFLADVSQLVSQRLIPMRQSGYSVHRWIAEHDMEVLDSMNTLETGPISKPDHLTAA